MMHFLQSYSCPPPQAGEGFPLVIPVIIVAGIVGLIIACTCILKTCQLSA